jgi:outer membrane protein assembly factor BamA
MHLIEARFDPSQHAFVGDELDRKVASDEVRLRYVVDAEHRDAAKAYAEALRERYVREGAVNVKVEVQLETHTRARAPEIAEAKSTADKLRTMWVSRRENLGDREARLLSKVAMLESMEVV